MEFRKHLRTGIWGLAGKALPVVYGLGFVLLVIRVLPEEEFGNYVLLQEIFLILTGLATAIALQPLLKFASEEGGAKNSVRISCISGEAARITTIFSKFATWAGSSP